MIPQQFIDELLRRVDVVEIVGQHVQLKRAGANYSGLCPFHTEKSPSFTVSPSKQFYHCFGCGAHGTALGFLIEHLGLPFPQAVEDLARRVGLDVPRETSAVDPEVRKKETDYRARLRDALLEAAKFYARRLKDSPNAVAYLKNRGLSGEIAAKYHLGYSPDGWQPLQSVFSDYQNKDLVDAGLVIEGEDGKRYDRFRDRIMFPILSARGEVLGFGARTLGNGEPKYLNSPETPVFSKGYELYGVFEARPLIREARQVWVVEGYMDVVALAQHGLGHAVATLGTATTPQHLQQLLRLSDHIVFMFDGDTAGRRAAARALETALPFASEKSRIDFAFLPQEHDPDSFVREHGAEKLKEWVGNAKPLSAFLLDVAAQDQQLEYAEGKAAAASQAQRMLKLMPSNVLRAQVAREAARRFDVSESSMLAALGVKADAASDEPSAAANNPAFKSAFKPRPKSGASGAYTTGRPPIRLPRPVIRPLTERILQIVVRVPDWSMQLDDEFLQSLDSLQAELLQWIQNKCRQQRTSDAQAVTTFAMLHESALAEGRDRGPDAVRLFLKLAKPDQALDDLIDNQRKLAEEELGTAILRHQIRVLEEAATQLAATAGQDPQTLADPQAVRVRIGELKASTH